MTASVYSKMAKIILNIIREAVEKGLNATKPVQLLLNGSTIQGDLAAPQRNVLVSFAQPAITADSNDVGAMEPSFDVSMGIRRGRIISLHIDSSHRNLTQ